MVQEIAGSWGSPSEELAAALKELRAGMEDLSAGLLVRDLRSELRDLVNASSLRSTPIHRWYYYKEGFSPLLPPLIVEKLGTGTGCIVVDAFAGVATTSLALRDHERVTRAIGVEYSPFAHFVGQVKLKSLQLDIATLKAHADRLSKFSISRRKQDIPELASFHNTDIFEPRVLRHVLSVRDTIREDVYLSQAERDFFLLGVAAVIEDLSGAMKDGRALRILHGRKRRRQGLQPSVDAQGGRDVRSVITNQWHAMIEDLPTTAGPLSRELLHMRGDARDLENITDGHGRPLLPDSSVGLHLYSPPYLNCIDYTEVYKLELWLLGFVANNAEFHALRDGTLRSHPSIEFTKRPNVSSRRSPVHEIIDATTEFLVKHLSRAPLGRVHGYYFADMEEVLRQQYRTLEPGSAIACVVANSTFARRAKSGSGASELWRIPILADVLIARLAEAVGFEGLEIWIARNLQARNVNNGYARESIVVARKPSFFEQALTKR